jgi:Ca2+-binding RTX toxin-like protein
MAQLVRKRGGETLVNTHTAGLQGWPAVASFADGGFVTVWNDGHGSDGSGWGVKAQRFDPSGAKAGGEFTVNELVGGNQLEPTVAVLTGGNFVVTWMAPSNLLKARLFNPSGQAIGSEFQVNAGAAGEQSQPNVFALANGGFAVAWWDHGQYLVADDRIRVQMFAADGTRGPELAMGSVGSVNQAEGVGLASGNFVVVWLDQSQVNGAYPNTVRGQMFDSTGTAIGGEFLVSPNPAGASFPEITALPGGGFVAVWNAGDTLNRAKAQLFDAAGAKVGGVITVGENVYEPKVAALSWGGFLLAWLDYSNSSYTLKGQLFDGSGNLLGSQFQINSAAGEAGGANLELSTLPGDVVVAVWRNEEGGAGERVGIKMQMLATPNVVGTIGNDSLLGGTGDDAIVGLAGADQMSGGLGDDIYHVDQIGDAVIELAGEGRDSVETGLGDYRLPDHVEDLTGTGSTGQILRGNALDNVLTGGRGGDSLHLGGAGSDTAKGGAGDDLLVVDWQDSTAAFAVTSSPTFDFADGQNQGYKGAFESGPGRSVAFSGIDRFHIIAGSADDTLSGAAGNDILDGGVGDDVLVGDYGADVLIGGPGIDTADYTQRAFNDLVVNLSTIPHVHPDGTMIPAHSVWDGFGVFDTLAEVENVKTGAGWDIVYGDHAANRIETGAGLDLLRGGGGADVLIGGLDNDRYVIFTTDGAVFEDTIVELAGGGVDEVATDLASFTLVGIAEVEWLTGTSANGQSLTGNDLNNYIRGAGGIDTLEGGIGNDRLDGGGGADTLRGGTGDDIYDVGEAGDVVVENAGEGTDSIRTALATYSLQALPHVENLTATSAGAHEFRGNAGSNVLTGGAGNDFLLLQDGGEDRGHGGAGNDALYFGSSFGAGDLADGGPGRDALVLQGNVTVVLTDASIAGIESISLQSGATTKFGDTANNRYDFSVTTSDGNVSAGQQLIVNGQSLLAGEDLTFDGSAETDGKFLIYAGHGTDILKGGAGVDVFFFEGDRWGPDDRVDGGAGRDAVVISGGTGLKQVTFGANSLTNIESISVNATLASDPSAKPSYAFVLHNGNVAPGGNLIVNGNSLVDPAQTVRFDGSAVMDGTLTMYGGAGNDTLIGGAGGDLLYGGLGKDSLTGNAGADIFQWRSSAEASTANPDAVLDFLGGVDKIDLHFIDADTLTPGDQAFRSIGSAGFTGGGGASAGELRAYSHNGVWMVEGDTNGDGLADFAIAVTTQGNVTLLHTDLIL